MRRPEELVGRSVERTIRVAMGDVDASRIHFAAVFGYADRCSADLFHELDLPPSAMLNSGFGLPVVHAAAQYIRPFGLDDLVAVRSSVTETGGKSLSVEHRITRCDDRAGLALVTMVHVCVSLEGGEAVPLTRLLEAMAVSHA